MTASRIRLTMPTRLVLDILLAAGDDLLWGYRICEQAGLGSGTVYPILERLEEAGWIEGTWEADQPGNRPRRRFYAVTGTGRASYATALTARRPSLRWRLEPGQDPA
jgi:PadR family transcriptional regulator PadR